MTAARERENPFWGYDDLALFFGLSLPAFLAALAVIRVARWLLPEVFAPRAMQALPFQLLFYILLFGSLWILMRVKYGRPLLRSLAWIYPFRGRWVMVVLGPLLAIGVAALGAALKAPPAPIFDGFLTDRLSIAMLALFVVVLGPMCEELAFRGLLYPVLARSLGTVPGILVSAVLFGMLHLQQSSWSWQHMAAITAAGAAFGWARWWTGSTAAAALLHASYNFTVLVFFLMTVPPLR
jgi:membrane protease YdiL (CAAX protease family)